MKGIELIKFAEEDCRPDTPNMTRYTVKKEVGVGLIQGVAVNLRL
jgi:hypothetical protein